MLTTCVITVDQLYIPYLSTGNYQHIGEGWNESVKHFTFVFKKCIGTFLMYSVKTDQDRITDYVITVTHPRPMDGTEKNIRNGHLRYVYLLLRS